MPNSTLAVPPANPSAGSPSLTPQKFLYSRKEASWSLGISVRSLDYLVANKQLAFRRLGKKILIPAAELSRFARADHYSLTSPLTTT